MSEHASGGKVVKAGIGYTIGNILIRGIGFLTMFLFSRLMDTEQFGVYNGFVAVDAILFVLAGLALHSSVKSAHYTFPGETDRYVSSLTLIYLLNLAFLALLVACFGETIARLLKLPRESLYLLLLYSGGSSLLSLYNNRISLDYAYRRYILISLCNTVGNIGFSLLLMLTVFDQNRAMGRIVGSTASIVLVAAFLLFTMWRKAAPRFDRRYWKFGVGYSLPIVPHGLSQVLLSQFDIIMIRELDSDAHAGIYGLAVSLKIVLTVISGSISTVWETWFFSEIDRGNRELIRKRASQLVWFFAFLTAGVMLLAPELLLLGGKNYAAGRYVVIPMILDGFILFLYNVIVPSEYYMKKTKYIMAGTMAAAAIDIVTNYIFIKRFGYVAAAYTTLFSYVCYVAMHVLISRRVIGFDVIPLRQLFGSVAVVAALAVFDRICVDRLLLRYLVNAAALAVFALSLLRMARRDGLDPLAAVKKKLAR